jgi:hypothetical protein
VRGHARLVAHHVLAVPHRLDRDRRAFVEDGRGQHHVHRLVLEDGALVGDAFGLRILLPERFGQFVLDRVKRHELGTGGEQAVDLPIDMVVIDADNGEADGHSLRATFDRLVRRPRASTGSA